MQRPTATMLRLLAQAHDGPVRLNPAEASPLTVRGLLHWNDDRTCTTTPLGETALADQEVSPVYRSSGRMWVRLDAGIYGTFAHGGPYTLAPDEARPGVNAHPRPYVLERHTGTSLWRLAAPDGSKLSDHVYGFGIAATLPKAARLITAHLRKEHQCST